MRKSNADSTPGNPQAKKGVDPVTRQLEQAYYTVVKRFETTEACFNDRGKARKETATANNLNYAALKNLRQTEYLSDHETKRKALSGRELQLESAYQSAKAFCRKLGVDYKPGITTAADILWIPPLPDAEVAVIKNLKYGVALDEEKGVAMKIVCSALCAVVSSIAMGGLIVGISPKHPTANVAGAMFALVLGSAVSVLTWRFLDRLWGIVGTTEGALRPPNEIDTLLLSARLQTGTVLAALMVLDASGIMLANTAKAALNPTLAIPLWLAILIAGCINIAYVSASSNAGRARCYNKAARQTIDGHVQLDIREKQKCLIQCDVDSNDDLKRSGQNVQAALEAMSQVSIMEEGIHTLKDDLSRAEHDHMSGIAEINKSLEKVSDDLLPSEKEELRILASDVQIAEERLKSHEMSKAFLGHSSEEELEGDEK